MTNPLDGFMGSSSKAFQFENIGDQVTGVILEITERQQTDLNTGEPKFWANGQPRTLFAIRLQTDIREDEQDDGIRHVNVKWKSLQAVRDAVRAAGAKNIALGGQLTLKYIANGPRGTAPQPPKLWAAHYVPPDPASTFMGAERPQANVALGQTAVGARQVDHHGQPQDASPPAWAQPPAREQSATTLQLLAQQQRGLDRIKQMDAYQREQEREAQRQKFGF